MIVYIVPSSFINIKRVLYAQCILHTTNLSEMHVPGMGEPRVLGYRGCFKSSSDQNLLEFRWSWKRTFSLKFRSRCNPSMHGKSIWRSVQQEDDYKQANGWVSHIFVQYMNDASDDDKTLNLEQMKIDVHCAVMHRVNFAKPREAGQCQRRQCDNRMLNSTAEENAPSEWTLRWNSRSSLYLYAAGPFFTPNYLFGLQQVNALTADSKHEHIPSTRKMGLQ